MDGARKDSHSPVDSARAPFSTFEMVDSPSRSNNPFAAQRDVPANGNPQTLVIARLQASITEIQLAIDAELAGDRLGRVQSVQRAAGLLAADSVRQPRAQAATPSTRGGLSPWQASKLKQHIATHLHSRLSVKTLSALVCLSRNHFSRAFKHSFRVPPHTYVSRRRIEHAQHLMLTTTMSLGQLAVECGLSDQPHFNRMFRRFVGDTPAAWRRVNVTQRLN